MRQYDPRRETSRVGRGRGCGRSRHCVLRGLHEKIRLQTDFLRIGGERPFLLSLTMSDKTVIVFFGCWGAAGHYLWLPNMQSLPMHEANKMSMPTLAQLDGSQLFLPRPEKIGTGTITYLPAPNLTVLAWWGNNPWDRRGAVNNAIITNGNLGETEMWQRFTRYFPDLSKRLKRPLFTRGTRKCRHAEHFKKEPGKCPKCGETFGLIEKGQ